MASLMDVAMRRAGEGRLDLPVSLLMGAAASMLVFLMPVETLEGLVATSGLPGLFPPAAPPLGITARIAAAIVAAVVGFGLAFALMRLADRVAGASRPAVRFAETDEDALPRVRRRDLHPDNPVRRPISAWRDLGLPSDEDPEPPRRRPPLVDIMEERHPPVMPWEQSQPSGPRESAIPQEHNNSIEGPAPVVPPRPAVREAHDSPEADRRRGKDEGSAAPAAATRPRISPERGSEPETIGALLARLERALDHRQQPRRRPAPAPVPDDTAAPATEGPLDLRLRSALDNLRRFAPQRG